MPAPWWIAAVVTQADVAVRTDTQHRHADDPDLNGYRFIDPPTCGPPGRVQRPTTASTAASERSPRSATGLLTRPGRPADRQARSACAFEWCLLALVPWVTVVGYERVGHRHNARVLAELDA